MIDTVSHTKHKSLTTQQNQYLQSRIPKDFNRTYHQSNIMTRNNQITTNAISLEEKIRMNGGSNGYALEIMAKTPSHRGRRKGSQTKTPRDAYGRPKHNRGAELSSNGGASATMNDGSIPSRTFNRKHSDSTKGTTIATPSYIHQASESYHSTTPSALTKTPCNPYQSKSNLPPSSAKFARNKQGSRNNNRFTKHIVCSLSENLARETCITSMDATSPTTIEVHKMANGQTYIETLSYLEMICPHEVLLNEGRRNSQLCRKVVDLFNNSNSDLNVVDDDLEDADEQTVDEGDSIMNDVTNTAQRTQKGRAQRRHQKKTHCNKFKTPSRRQQQQKTNPTIISSTKHGECDIQIVVKFLPRSYFDQTRGAELLQRVALDTSYDPSIINEYIVLSSSYALVSYLQSCLGSNFNRNSLRIAMNWGGKYRMAIDRNTISHLELLSNAQTGKNKNSLIGTIDCTKTNVGSRLLRSNLMSPPTGIATTISQDQTQRIATTINPTIAGTKSSGKAASIAISKDITVAVNLRTEVTAKPVPTQQKKEFEIKPQDSNISGKSKNS